VGLSAQRIYQDLVEEKGFSDSYHRYSVLFASSKWRSRSGFGAWKLGPARKCRSTLDWEPPFGKGVAGHVGVGLFAWCLATRGKAYSEAVLRQDTETFLRCLENGLRAFGGVPLLLTWTT